MGLIFNCPTEGAKNWEILSKLDGILSELSFRDDYKDTCYPGYKDMSWDELCDKGIELFQKLKELEKNET